MKLGNLTGVCVSNCSRVIYGLQYAAIIVRSPELRFLYLLSNSSRQRLLYVEKFRKLPRPKAQIHVLELGEGDGNYSSIARMK